MWTVRTAGDWARPAGGSAAEAGDDSKTGEAAGGSVSAGGDLATAEPAGTSAMAEPADGSGTTVLCGSSSEREKEADVWASGSCDLASGDGASVSAAATAGDWASVFGVNSGFAWSERSSSLIWSFLCQICP